MHMSNFVVNNVDQ